MASSASRIVIIIFITIISLFTSAFKLNPGIVQKINKRKMHAVEDWFPDRRKIASLVASLLF